MAAKLPFYIIESNRPGYTCIQMKNNERFKALCDQEAARTLPKPPNATVMPRAVSHQTRDMLVEDIYDVAGGIGRVKFLDEVIEAQADERGRIFIDSTKPELARRILREIRILDPTVKMDPMGQILPEEMPNFEKPRNMGGRPRRPN